MRSTWYGCLLITRLFWYSFQLHLQRGQVAGGSNGYIPPYIIMPRLHRIWISCLCRQLIISTDWRLMYTTHRKEAREIMTPTYIHYQVQSSNLESKLIHLCQNILEQGTNCNRRRVLRRFLGVNNQSRSQWVSLIFNVVFGSFDVQHTRRCCPCKPIFGERGGLPFNSLKYGPNNCALRFMYCMILKFFKWMFAFISHLFLYWIEEYSVYSSKWIGNFAEVVNLSCLFLNLNRVVYCINYYRLVLPDRWYVGPPHLNENEVEFKVREAKRHIGTNKWIKMSTKRLTP